MEVTRTELERLVAVEENLTNVCASVDLLVADMKNTATKDDIHALSEKLDDFTKTADKRYAEKRVESVVYGMVALTLLTVLGAVLTLVLKAA